MPSPQGLSGAPDYLIEVADNTCIFYPPFERVKHIKVGRLYRKKLTEKFNAI